MDADKVLQLQAAVLARQRLDEAAAAFATRLAEWFECDRVCVGFIEDGCARVLAMSHGVALDAKQELTRGVAAAMDEAVDQAATINFPAAMPGNPRITLAHAELARRHSSAACSIPIANLGAIVGAVTLERASDRPLNPQELTLGEDIVSLVGPVLALKFESQRPWRARARQTINEGWSRLTGPGELRLKLSVAGIALAAAFVFLLPLPYHVTAPARLEGAIQRALVAAADGFIQQVSVRPGDAVQEGQILVELAQQDLQLERSRWESELAQQTNAYGAALARADRSTLMVSHAKVAESRAQLDLVNQQIERAQIKAPFDGIVISGDLTQSLGAPVQRGNVLMVIAPHDRYRLIVEADERDIVDVKVGAEGRISLAALPGEVLHFRTERIAPLAVTRDSRHFFEVEGKPDAGTRALRPGLQGVAKIEAGSRPLASRVFHRLLVWLRLNLWSWGVWQ
ncbi:MAG: efflux RND transporter periplasmic adaptor subunit [Betaproteobacteria bacterium]|nr:efflux RND transporter periplasmic adaptor subunit [Betaproteobacteria bacterium]